MIKTIAVVGPTASGKTSLAIELAKRLDGEIISCDSMQIYKYMNIGTAKPDESEIKEVVHHLIGFVDPREDFSCADYADLAKKCIYEISSKGKMPVFCGGTGLYVDHTLGNTSFSDIGCDEAFRSEMRDIAKEYGNVYLHKKLADVDKSSAEKIHFNNVQRVIRALEIYHLTGKTKSYYDSVSKNISSEFDSKYFFLDFKDRDKLYSRIDFRVDLMMENGLLEEVEFLRKNSLLKDGTTAAQAIGYKELIEYFENKCSLDDAVNKIKQNTRNYAKRQLTWFRRNDKAITVFVDEFETLNDIADFCMSELH